jgi:hypothetical protein
MAEDNKNTGPQNIGSLGVDPNKLKQSLKDLLDDQGDYNNLLRNALADLKKMDGAYGKIESRLQSLNKDSVNVKQINQELFRLKQKEFLEQKKLNDLTASYGIEASKALELAKANTSQLMKDADTLGEKIDYEETMLKYLKDTGNLEAISLYASEKQLEIAKKQTEEGKILLQNEKEVAKQLGISGNLMQKFADKLGVGEEAYAAMTAEARKLVDQNGKVGGFGSKLKVLQAGFKAGAGAIKESFSDPVAKAALVVGAYKAVSAGLDMVGNAAASAGNFMAGLSEDSGNVVRGLTGGISDLARKIPLVGGLLGGLIDGFSALLDLVLGVDNMIVKTGRQLNLSAEGARSLYRNLAAASQASGDIYMNGKKYLESQLELTQQLGVANVFSAEILRTNIRLKDFAGLEADTRAKIAETAQITGKSAEGTVKSVLSQVKGLQRLTGISFQYQQVLKEISNLGGYLGLQFAKYPDKLAKAFVTTKALGLELKQLDGMASSFLDFESSISKEFEAQLLTGKDINLSKARELFLNNDLAGAAAEIAKHTGDAAGYSKMNRIQQDSLAEAMGMSRDQMADMLKQQELYSKFGVKNREDLLKQVDSLRKAGKEQEAINKAGGEAAYNDLVRASAQEKLALTIEKIKQSIVEFVENSGLIEKVEQFMEYLTKPGTIKGIIGTIRDAISTFIEVVGEILADVVEVGGEIANFFTFGKKGDQREAAAYELGAKIRAGSSEMSNRIAGTGNYSGGSVSDAAAKDKLKTEPAAPKTPDNSMSMAKPPDTKVYVLNQMNAITGKALTVPIEEGMYFAQGGQIGKSTTG